MRTNDERELLGLLKKLQSWTKVLGKVTQYSVFSVILSSLIEQCILFEIFFSSPPPFAMSKLGIKKILDTPVHHFNWLWGEGRGGTV